MLEGGPKLPCHAIQVTVGADADPVAESPTNTRLSEQSGCRLADPQRAAQRRQRCAVGQFSPRNGGGVRVGYSLHSGQITLADGTPEAAAAIEHVLTNNPGNGVMRHADAGYPEALDCARERGRDLPMA